MYTTQVDLYEIIKRFSEPAKTPETIIFVIYLRFRPARVLAFLVAFAAPAQALLDASWTSRTEAPKSKKPPL